MWASWIVLGLAPALVAGADENFPELASLLRQAERLRPNLTDFRWQQIPWYTDGADALKQARQEKRPLLVWLAGGRDRDGTPLERC